MSILPVDSGGNPVNPLDLVEEIVSSNEWPFDRPSDRELTVEFQGRWCDYRLYFGWVAEISAMQFTCTLDLKVPRAKLASVQILLSFINERLWLGHFGVGSEEGILAFHHAILLRGARGASVEQLEDLVDISMSECERFYPAIQYVIWGGKTPYEAIEAALLETVGEA